MTRNQIVLIILGFFIIGFGVGRFTALKPSEIVKKTEVVKSESKIAEVGTQANVQKDSNKDKIQVDIKKNYSPEGKLISTEYQSFKLLDRTTNDISTTRLALSDTQNSTTTITKTKTIYQPNWLIGLSVPFTTYRDYQHFDLVNIRALLSYRVIGNFYVTLNSTYKIQNSEIGLMIGF